jgi:YD repeat-containing protein
MRGKSLFFFAVLSLLSPLAKAQTGPALGFDPFSTFQSSSVDNVNLTNGNVAFKIPLFSLPQRGAFKPITFYLGADTAGWTIAQRCDDPYHCYYSVQNTNPGGFGIQLLSDVPQAGTTGGLIPYSDGSQYGSLFANFSIPDELGTNHPLVFQSGNPTILRTVDGSGYLVTNPGGSSLYDPYYKEKTYGPTGPYPATPLPVITNRSGVHTLQIPSPDVYYGTDSPGYWYSGLSDLDGNTIMFPDPFYYNVDGIRIDTITDTIGRQLYPGYTPTINTDNSTGNCPNLGIAGQVATAWSVHNLVSSYGQAAPDPRYSYKICYTTINYHTNSFGGVSGHQSFSYDPQEADGFVAWSEAIGQAQVIQSVVSPDGSYWGFVYDSVADPATNPNAIAMGSITKIITPEGGAIAYCYNLDNSYSLGNGLQGVVLSPVFPVITRRQEQSAAGSNLDACSSYSGYYSYTISPQITFSGTTGTATVIDPAGNKTNHSFGLLGETSTDVYEGSGTGAILLKHTENQYTSANLPQPAVGYSSYNTPTGFIRSQTTILNGAAVGSQSSNYDQSFSGAAWSCNVYPFPPSYGGCSQSSPVALRIGFLESTTTNDGAGNILSYTENKFQADPDTPGNSYWSANLIDLKSQVTTSDSASSAVNSYSYDESAYSPGGIRGHLTTTTTGGGYPLHTYWLSSLGLVDHVVDARSTTVATYQYDPTTYASQGITYQSASGPVTIGNVTYSAALQPTTITSPIGTDSYTYDITSGLAKSHTDVNNKTTTIQYDGMNRVWAVQYPDAAAISPLGQSKIACYLSPNTVTVYQAKGTALSLPSSSSTCPSSSDAIVTTENVDGLGRKVSVILNSAPEGPIETDTTYDSMGRVYSVSNPYVGTPTGFSTTTTYDALSRPRLLTEQDGSQKHSDYLGLTTTLTDEVHNIKQTMSDFVGRVTDVYEPTAPNTNPTLHTNYTYNVFGLTGVTQYGAMARSFNYNYRLLNATNPETGTVNYGYLLNSSICASDLTLPCSKTDARGSTTNYSYDGMNRLTSKTYSGTNAAATPSTCYQYDTATNGKGRLAAEWTLFGDCTSTLPASGYLTLRSILAYDAMGRITQEQQCHRSGCTTSGTPFNQAINYDLAGNLTSYGNGLGALTITNSYDTAGRLFQVGSSINDATHPQSIYSISDFWPSGTPHSSMLGGHISITQEFDSRLRSKSLSAVKQ